MEHRSRIWDHLQSPDTAISPVPLVELAGDRRILIENHKGVTQYSREQIAVAVKYGQLIICGCGLELSRMHREQLVICGQIESVRIVRRC